MRAPLHPSTEANFHHACPEGPSGRDSPKTRRREGGIFLGVVHTELDRSSVLLQTESFPGRLWLVGTETRPPSAEFTGDRCIFVLPPPRHNRQRDWPERSNAFYLDPHQAFKQKTSPLVVALSPKAASKLLTFFFGFSGKRFVPRFDVSPNPQSRSQSQLQELSHSQTRQSYCHGVSAR